MKKSRSISSPCFGYKTRQGVRFADAIRRVLPETPQKEHERFALVLMLQLSYPQTDRLHINFSSALRKIETSSNLNN